MNVSAINLTNQKNFGKTGVEQLVNVANTVTGAKELNADTIQRVADCIDKEKYNFIIQKSFFSDLIS